MNKERCPCCGEQHVETAIGVEMGVFDTAIGRFVPIVQKAKEPLMPSDTPPESPTQLAYFAAHAPQMPREFVQLRLSWPKFLPEWSYSESREDWEQAQERSDNYQDRWRALDPKKRIELGIEWRWEYARMMIKEQSKES